MSKSIITLITVLTLVVLHGVHYFFGLSGIMYALGAVVVFFGFARMLYWRQLRKLRQSTRSLPPEYRAALYDVCGLDAEARKDMEKLDRENQSPDEKARPTVTANALAPPIASHRSKKTGSPEPTGG